MGIQAWKMISSKVVFEHPRMVLAEDVVELPDGKKIDYLRYASAKMHSVAIIAINEKQEILLQREYSYPVHRVVWQLPGGGIKDGEDTIAAANRELSEESGIVGASCEILGSYYVNNRRSDEKQYVVLCKNVRLQQGKRDEEEFIENHWIPITDLSAMIAKGEIDNIYLLAAINLWSSTEGTN